MLSPFMLSKRRPPFIVIEGGEGSGKSSLMIALQDALGDAIVTTREPGGTPYAEVIRDVTLKYPLAKGTPAETTLCLMFAARYDNTIRAILPALDAGKPVVADRFDGSSYTYQVWAQSKGVLEELFWTLRSRLAVTPDLYIFVDVDPKEGIRRARSRNQSLLNDAQYDHFDDREVEFHERVRVGYFEFLSRVPHIVIDANRPFERVRDDFISEIKSIVGHQ